ncbi:hypothetical protein P421_04790 [Heyndrickxia coagulans P38]|jgi:hypothetical protein|nr:hypothetical protein P421_04790 [Heyndrickxia coagulans P38]
MFFAVPIQFFVSHLNHFSNMPMLLIRRAKFRQKRYLRRWYHSPFPKALMAHILLEMHGIN